MSMIRTWVEEEGHSGHYESEIDFKHQRKPFEGHYPAKDEATLLRKIMSQTGLTEAEVRDRKKYRVMLSETQKPLKRSYGYYNRCKIFFKRIVKESTRETKLALAHPITIAEIAERFENATWGHRYEQPKDCSHCRSLLAQAKRGQLVLKNL